MDKLNVMDDLNCWNLKFKYCIYSVKLLRKIALLNKKVPNQNQVNIQDIKKAIYYAKKYHGEQKRQSGEPYYSHPLAVAEMVAPYCFKTDILVVSILHDVLEDTELTKDMLTYIFDEDIANKVDDLTRVKPDRKISAAEMVELLYLQGKKELLLVKLFDRLHNMQTISAKSPASQERTIVETLINFLPTAAHLALYDIEQILDQICFNAVFKKIHIQSKGRYGLFFEEHYQPLVREIQNA